MKHRLPLGRTLAIVTLIGAALSLLSILQSPSKPSPRAPSAPDTLHKDKVEAVASYGLPVRLKIPKISVDAPIEQLGLTPQGDMQAPSEPHQVGWYKFGPRPGDKGSAVIAGHYGPGRDGKISAFDELHTLSKGDRLYVEDEKGVTATFVVREFRTYKPNEAAPDVFSSSDGKAHLNLITCQGDWDNTELTYSNRLVLFADKETS